MADYPTRESFFFHRFCRLLVKSAAAMEIGPEGCWLLQIVASTEDVKRYRGPVLFWNEQLAALCGFGGKSRLVNARAKAIESGWLHYESGGKGKAGKYWVKIPPRFADLEDSPVDENPAEYREISGISGPETGRQTDPETENAVPNQDGKSEMPSQNGTTNGRKRDGKPSSFIPSPKPNTPPTPPSGGESWESDLAEARRILKAIHPADQDGWLRATAAAPESVRAVIKEMGGWSSARGSPDKDFAREFKRRWQTKYSTRRRDRRKKRA